MSIGYPACVRAIGKSRLEADTRQLAEVLRIARSEAVSGGTAKTVEFYPYTDRYRVVGGNDYYFSPGITYFGLPSFTQQNGKPRCMFSATGAAVSGGTVAVRNQYGDKLYVIVAPVTGRIRISETGP